MVRLPESADTQGSIVQAVLHQHDTTVQMSRLLSESCATLQRQVAAQAERLLEVQGSLEAARKRSSLAWTACATGVVAVVFLSFMALESDRQAVTAKTDGQAISVRLNDAEKELADLRLGLAEKETEVLVSDIQSRHLADTLSAVQCERDRLLLELEEARIEVANLHTDLLVGGRVAYGMGSVSHWSGE